MILIKKKKKKKKEKEKTAQMMGEQILSGKRERIVA